MWLWGHFWQRPSAFGYPCPVTWSFLVRSCERVRLPGTHHLYTCVWKGVVRAVVYRVVSARCRHYKVRGVHLLVGSGDLWVRLLPVLRGSEWVCGCVGEWVSNCIHACVFMHVCVCVGYIWVSEYVIHACVCEWVSEWLWIVHGAMRKLNLPYDSDTLWSPQSCLPVGFDCLLLGAFHPGQAVPVGPTVEEAPGTDGKLDLCHPRYLYGVWGEGERERVRERERVI